MPASQQPRTNERAGVPDPLMVSLADAAARLSLCDRTIRRAISAGDLPGYKLGKSLRVRLDELDAWAMAKAIPNARTGTKAGTR